MAHFLPAAEANSAKALAEMPAAPRPGAHDLVHDLAMRQIDLRRMQQDSSARGRSSLGRVEAHVLATIGTIAFAISVDPASGSEAHSAIRMLGDQREERGSC